MFKNVIFIFLLLQIEYVIAQNILLDSLEQIFNSEKIDTLRCLKMIDLSYEYSYSKPKIGLEIARRALILARDNEYLNGEVEALQAIGGFLSITGNSAIGLDYSLQALNKIEKTGDQKKIGNALFSVGFAYYKQGDFKKYLEYNFRSLQIAKNIDSKFLKLSAYVNIGDGYERLNQLDSAFYYIGLAQQLSSIFSESDTAIIYLNLGNIYFKREKYGLAIEHYRTAIPMIEKLRLDEALVEGYLGISRSFKASEHIDSSLYYSQKAIKIAKNNGFIPRIIELSEFLTDYYKEKGQVDSAYSYLSLMVNSKDSLFNQEKTNLIQGLTFKETMRQQEIEIAKVEQIKNQKINLQYAIVSVGLICLVVVFLLLTNSVLIHERWIKFLGVLALLLVFEFINLMFHSYIAEFTHHSPILMLLILVAIASLLIPLHHKIEKWITNKVVSKNRRLRLAAAKRTLKELGEEMLEINNSDEKK